MNRQRAAILRKREEPEVPCPYEIELTRRGFLVERCFDSDALLTAISTSGDEVSVIVLDALTVNERRALVDKVVLALYEPPRVFWIAEQASCNSDVGNEFEHELIGPRDSVKVILHGDLATFRCRLDFFEAWLTHNPIPRLTLRHSRRALLLDRVGVSPYREWLSRFGCDPFEAVVDVLLHDFSLRDKSRTLGRPVRRLDLYVIDRLAQARCALSLEDLARSLTDPASYVFAMRLASKARREGFTTNSVKNAVSRLRRALTALGVNGHDAILLDEDTYTLNRSAVRITVEHVQE
jgi:hypothetical protein